MQTSRIRVDSSMAKKSYRTYSCEVPYSRQTIDTGQIDGLLKTCYDNNNGNFTKRRSRGEVVLSDCQMIRYERSFTPGYLANGRTESHGGDLSTICYTGVKPDVSMLMEQKDFILVKAYAKMNEGEVLSGELVHDLGQTVQMLRSPFKSITDLVVKMARARDRYLKVGAKGLAQASAKAWLEYRYGMKPAISDVKEIIRSSEHKLSQSKRRLIARAGWRGQKNGSSSWPATRQADGVRSSAGNWLIDNKSTINAGVIYDLYLADASEDWARRASLRVCDIPSTLWETLPFSFVADWVFNVGDWIRAFTPNPSIFVHGHWVTTYSDRTENMSASCVWPSGTAMTPALYTGSFGSSKTRVSEYIRETNTVLANHPVMRYNGFSWQHQADALSLIIGSITSGLKGLRH